MKTNSYNWILGNHELFFIDNIPKILNDEIDDATKEWLFKYGGKETLKSYLLENSELDKELLTEYLEYLKSLPNYIEYKVLKTIHFGRFKSYDNKDIYNVFGHTPVEKVDIENSYKTNIDTGCVYDNGTNMKGWLTALKFPNLKSLKQKNNES